MFVDPKQKIKIKLKYYFSVKWIKRAIYLLFIFFSLLFHSLVKKEKYQNYQPEILDSFLLSPLN